MTVLAFLTALLASRYFGRDPDDFLPEQRAVYLAHLTPLLLHIGGGVAATVLGPWQFLPRLRTRHPAVHRLIGRGYLLSVLVTGIGGLAMAPHGLYGPIAPLGFATLAVLLLGTTTAAFVTVRRGAVARHRVWMTRSYALIFAAVTFRLWVSLLPMAGVPFEQAYMSGAWTCSLINLLVADRLTARPTPRRSTREAEAGRAETRAA
ncbi:DUF2306 domain-containing protein [Kitasatospora nipponensis]|uniref:DUF2306 domain-containing protein n=2 Tax=Kitasatospora nipponensis TaxID=258049 RepID=A0ABN1W349_9ACTN